jgi:hypothetical protein
MDEIDAKLAKLKPLIKTRKKWSGRVVSYYPDGYQALDYERKQLREIVETGRDLHIHQMSREISSLKVDAFQERYDLENGVYSRSGEDCPMPPRRWWMRD